MSDEFPDLSRWEDRLSDELDTAEDFPDDAVVDAKSEAARRKAAQTHRFRGSLFRTVTWSLVGTLLAAVGIMGVYLASQWHHVDSAVMISFNAAVVVNTIGLAYIVANYLFPKGGGE